MSGPTLAVVAIASAVVGSYAQIQAAKAQKQMYDRQADITEKQARQKSLAYKQEGVNSLKKMNRIMAANAARAASGNLDPYSSGDSYDVIATYNLRQGVHDFTIARDNATLAEKFGKYQADNYRYAGRVAVSNAKTMAVANIGMSFVSAGMVYGTSGLTGLFSGSATAANTASTAQTISTPAMATPGVGGYNFAVV